MPPYIRKRNELAQEVMPLVILTVALIGSNRYFTMIDDETLVLDGATRSVRSTLALFWSGVGQFEHPPLYDILLHFWLRITGGNFEYLRIPSIFLFVGGLFLLARAAVRLGSPSSGLAVVWLGALWPFGFHYGRLVIWYGFSFFLIAGLTLAYLRYLEKPSFERWAVFFLLGAALLWTNYFGWALLGCFAIDQFLRHRAGEVSIRPGVIAGTAGLLCAAFIPLFRAFYGAVATGMNPHRRAVAVIANAAFNVYSLFVSESVAPWYWRLSVPAGLAMMVCGVLVFLNAPRSARRFFLYSGLLMALMAVTGILLTKRLFLVAPWVLLPVGVTIAGITSRWTRVGLGIALLVIGAIGWFGIYSRRYYSAPRFIEPWLQVAGDAADKVQSGATVIANNPSFFFYLTYILRVPDTATNWKFAGVLPDTVHTPRVTSAYAWIASGHPFTPVMIWIRGMDGPQIETPMDDAAHVLDRNCGARQSRLTMRDEGYTWKHRFFPDLGELQWRIEVRQYDCAPATSPEIFPLPSR